ncbi:MAG: hypothetical protein DRI90_01535 [Deltaproteobacteria bacterium]|nr:MAG: hypothetical protein DRI90_01535 [Deltaproteobacteria bacterium]
MGGWTSGRFDEALDVYETLLTQYAQGLSKGDQAALGPVMVGLRKKIGRIWVSANVEGAVVLIDGNKRGKLPRKEPVRALSGQRVVRVVLAGYDTFEATVDVEPGERVTVDAKLRPLTEVGRLRVEDESGLAARVFVDGVEVGTAPWEGLLRPGAHRVWLRKDDLGSRLLTVTILEGQIALVRAKATALGAPIRIEVQPRTAAIEIDGIGVGVGTWEGRLAVGDHTIEAFEGGYHGKTAQLVSRKGDAPSVLAIPLPVDRDHPRWPSPYAGDLWLDAFAAYAGGPTFGSGAERACPSECSNEPWVNGFMAGGRLGYRFPFGLSVELNGGYLWLGASVDRSLRRSFGPSGEYRVTYQLQDSIAVRGPFVGPGASYRYGFNDRFGLVARLSVGVFFSVATDEITGTAATDGAAVPVVVSGNEPQRNVTFFVMPALGTELRLDPFDVGLALGAAFFPLAGPELPNQRLSTTSSSGVSNPGSVYNAPASDAIANERAYGMFGLLVPQLSLAYTFD